MPIPYFVNGCSSAVMIVQQLEYYGGKTMTSAGHVVTKLGQKGQAIAKNILYAVSSGAARAVESAANDAHSKINNARKGIVSVVNVAKEEIIFTTNEMNAFAEKLRKENPRRFYVITSMAALGMLLGAGAVLSYYYGKSANESFADCMQDDLLSSLSCRVADGAMSLAKAAAVSVFSAGVSSVGAVTGSLFGHQVISKIEKYEHDQRVAAEARRAAAEQAAYELRCRTKKVC